MFKTITGVFKVSTTNNTHIEVDDCIRVKRVLSGATGYGDKSAHIIQFIGKDVLDKYYDTRYEGIPTKQFEWCRWWMNYLQKEYNVKLVIEKYIEGGVDDGNA